MSDLRDRAVRLYDAFTHGHRDRRRLMIELTALAGSFAAAEALAATIAASPAAAAIVDPNDPRLKTRKGPYPIAGGNAQGYLAEPRPLPARPTGAVMVLHENRGLTPHIEDVARRLSLAGFIAFAPDFLSAAGGTPRNEDQARDMIAAADMDAVVAQGLATIAYLRTIAGANGRVGCIGFCWGGALANRLAVAAGSALSAAIAYYGPAPDPAEAAKVAAPMLLHYAGKDARVNATGTPWTAALKGAGKDVAAYTYPNVDHAFNNDTSSARYDKRAADLAWTRTLAFLTRTLGR